MLIYRPPLTEGWHLIAMLLLGVAVVFVIHRFVRRRAAELRRRDEHS
jgi:hypothetical protein